MKERYVEMTVKIRMTNLGITTETDQEMKGKIQTWAEEVEKATTMTVEELDIEIKEVTIPKKVQSMLNHVKKVGGHGK